MKKILFLGLISMCSFSFGQGSFNSDAELNRMTSAPNSPEAQAFGSYGNNDINLRVGAPNISVPLYSYKGLEMDLPVSITYDMNARKVEDIATGMGLGWNLNLGGSVSRIVNGLPDELTSSPVRPYASLTQDLLEGIRTQYKNYKDRTMNGGYEDFGSFAEIEPFFKYLAKIQSGAYDVLLDTYSVNAPGLSEYVMQEFISSPTITVTPKAIGSPTTKIDSWSDSTKIVTSGDGTKYEFAEYETSTSKTDLDTDPQGAWVQGGPYNYSFRSTWFLTKITSPNAKDVYTFEYTPFNEWGDEVPTYISKKIFIDNPNNEPSTEQNSTGITRYNIAQKALSKVFHNNNLIIDITLDNRTDHQIGNKISSIDIKSPLDNSLMKRIEFEHSHFGPASVPPAEQNDKWRLKLDAVKFAGSGYSGINHVFEKTYSFNYDRPSEMPERSSKKQDMFGFYNGAGNSELFPEWIVNSNLTIPGADRSFSESHAKIGILTHITNPLGGTTVYKYDPHYHPNPEEELFGLRVTSITDYQSDDTSQNPISKTIYEYPIDDDFILESKMLPKLTYYTVEPYDAQNNASIVNYHRLAKNDMGDHPYISYNKVIKKVVNPVSSAQNYGRTEYTFYAGPLDQDKSGTFVDFIQAPFTQSYARNVKKGNLKTQKVYDVNNNLLSESLSDYNPTNFTYYPRYFVQDNPANRFYFVARTDIGGGVYRAEYVQGTGGTPNIPPPGCNCLNTPIAARIQPNNFAGIYEQYLLDSNSSSSQTLEGNTITTTSSTTYDPNVSYLMKESESSTSENGETYITKNYYPQEFAGQSQDIDDLITANRLVSPLKVESYRKVGSSDELISTQETEYNNNGTHLMPKSIKASRALDTPELRIVFDQYDANGNLVQVRKASGNVTSYIWGYDGRLPVAKIEGLSYDSAIATPQLSMSIIEDPTTNSAAMNTQTNKIRQSHPTAMVTSYTYNTNMDVVTITDPRGYVSTFFYDDEDRLEYVTDSDGKVLSSNEYNYKQ